MILDTLFPLLESVSYGVCAVSMDQKILFWSRSAECILGFSSQKVLGRRCYDVMKGTKSGSLTPECVGGCAPMRYLRAGLIPSATRLQMLCSSGERKWVSVTTAVIPNVLKGAPLLVYFFEDDGEEDRLGTVDDSMRNVLAESGTDVMSDHPEALPAPGETSALSRRELQVLRLVALGWDTPRIAAELRISVYTVRNLRSKLHVSSKLDAVVKGIRLGILSVGRSPQ